MAVTSTGQLVRRAKHLDTCGKLALLLGLLLLPFVGGKGESILWGLFFFAVCKGASLWCAGQATPPGSIGRTRARRTSVLLAILGLVIFAWAVLALLLKTALAGDEGVGTGVCQEWRNGVLVPVRCSSGGSRERGGGDDGSPRVPPKPPPAPELTDSEKDFNRALNAQQAGDVSAAIARYRRALDLDPKNAEAWNNLGVLYEEAGDPGAALDCYRKASDLKFFGGAAKRNYDRLLCRMAWEKGLHHMNRGDYRHAVQSLREALEHAHPENRAPLLLTIGMAERGAGNPAESEKALKEAIRLYGKGEAERAREELAALCAEEAAAAAKRGAFEDAESWYRKALKVRGGEADLTAGLKEVVEDQILGALFAGDHLRMETAARKLVELEPKDPDYRMDLGWALILNGATKRGIAEYEAAARLRPFDERVYFALGNALRGIDTKEALGAYEKGLRLIPPEKADQRAAALMQVGSLQLILGRTDDADRSFKAALAGAPSDPSIRAELGRIYLERGREQDALEHIGIALELCDVILKSRPDDESARKARVVAGKLASPILARSGEELLIAGRIQDARAAFEKAVEADPENWMARVNLEKIGRTTAPPDAGGPPPVQDGAERSPLPQPRADRTFGIPDSRALHDAETVRQGASMGAPGVGFDTPGAGSVPVTAPPEGSSPAARLSERARRDPRVVETLGALDRLQGDRQRLENEKTMLAARRNRTLDPEAMKRLSRKLDESELAYQGVLKAVAETMENLEKLERSIDAVEPAGPERKEKP